MNRITAPQLDSLLRIFKIDTFNPKTYDSKVKEKLNELFQLLDIIKPIDNNEEIKILYFSVEKGTIEDYGDYEELKSLGDVSNYEEFEKYYKEDYPDDIYWYKLVAGKYENYRTISINYNNIIYADMDDGIDGFAISQLQELLDFIITKVKKIINMLNDNTYNDYILKNLSYKNRFGVIKRCDYWNIYPNIKERLLNEISQDEIDMFIKFASNKVDERIKNMTSGKYFECVRLAYEINNYEIDNLNDKELYLKYADGRDEGLSKIDENSSEEFDRWYNDDTKFGGHPWEIIRGHSFARVNLQVGHDDNGYYLMLDGGQILRKIEIVKIFLALYKNNIPIQIYNVDIIKDALSGKDYIGIVPKEIMPIRCESYFNDYKPHEFIHIEDNKIINNIIWQEPEKVFLNKE